MTVISGDKHIVVRASRRLHERAWPFPVVFQRKFGHLYSCVRVPNSYRAILIARSKQFPDRRKTEMDLTGDSCPESRYGSASFRSHIKTSLPRVGPGKAHAT